MVIDRQKLLDGSYDREAQENEIVRVLTREEREASRRPILDRLGPGEDLWVFAYGSLIWNPQMFVAEHRPARVHGYRRAFCMWSPYSRGTPERPGLMLALDQGGCCTGLAYRIEASKVEEETEVLWAREMFSGIYEPRWVRVRTESGQVDAVTFVANRASHFYAGALDHEAQAVVLARAVGQTGPNIDYLRFLVQSLDERGLTCTFVEALHRRVQEVDGTVDLTAIDWPAPCRSWR